MSGCARRDNHALNGSGGHWRALARSRAYTEPRWALPDYFVAFMCQPGLLAKAAAQVSEQNQ
jgi:hypothetical protein